MPEYTIDRAGEGTESFEGNSTSTLAPRSRDIGADVISKAFELIRRAPTEEVLTAETLQRHLQNRTPLKHYIGFEISGFIHLGTGPLCMKKVADFQEAGADTNIFLADYHTWINKKLGGDLATIRRIGGTYFKEALKQSLKAVGGDPDRVHFIMGSELYEKLGMQYLEDIIKVSSQTSLARAKRSITVAGRREGESINFAQLLYVPMQVADIFGLGVNLAHAGMDQRKAHVVALEVAKTFDAELVAVHHHLLTGIHITESQRAQILAAKASGNREQLEQELIDIKMSKSNPSGAVFVHDTEEEIKKKINGAFCPMGEITVNPVLDLANFIVWPYLIRKEMPFEIENKKHGTTSTYKTPAELEAGYQRGEIHPVDLKGAVADYLAAMLEPVRNYFLEGNGRKHLEDIKSIKITR